MAINWLETSSPKEITERPHRRNKPPMMKALDANQCQMRHGSGRTRAAVALALLVRYRAARWLWFSALDRNTNARAANIRSRLRLA
jgi:hypothetical protein